jgi:hypothetical protein
MRLYKVIITTAAVSFLAGCGSSESFNGTGSTAASDAAEQLKVLGPPLTEAEEQPGLLDQYACGHGGSKVNICHVPPGNPDARHNICISHHAVQKHLAHGQNDQHVVSDYLGDCAGEVPDDGGDDTGGGDTGGDTGGEEPGGEDPGTGGDTGGDPVVVTDPPAGEDPVVVTDPPTSEDPVPNDL